MAFCLSLSLNSIPSNQAARLSKFKLLSSAIFLLSILNQRLSFFNLAPLHDVQGASSIYFSTQLRSISELCDELNHRLSIGIIPS